MKRKYVLIVITVLLIIMASITNPSKDDFIIWSKEKLKSESNNGLVNWGIEMFGDGLIASVTTTKNLVLISIFTVNLSETEKVKVLGIFNNFIPLSGPSEEGATDVIKDSEPKEVTEESPINSDVSKNINISILNLENSARHRSLNKSNLFIV